VTDVGVEHERFAQGSGGDKSPDQLETLLVSTLVADAEHLVRFRAGVEHALRAIDGHGQRFFAKELLARSQNLKALSLVHLMRGCQDNAVNVGARQGSVEIGKVAHPVVREERLHVFGRCRIDALEDREPRTALEAADDLLAPPPKAHNGDTHRHWHLSLCSNDNFSGITSWPNRRSV
jgi:hypothetical protein